ncbi:DEAH-box RNA helicase [Xylaria bambusicola]|uniref:DEAH-box RNA helicase n=1 Tax=Xylaria bambusicola TaxID=326684 RepID=UPI0020081103|nr:DEAH-box RNA helicase [Xylaria bambusicola]KAI0517658.1 DEAH-box RNA helicase [Xylaria bambusicola]
MAKKFVPRQRKHKVLAREAREAQQAAVEDGTTPSAHIDSNAVEILPDSKKAAEEAKRARMKAELKGDAKMSSKKAKRLEKYIDKKLAKDENRALLAQLAANKIDTSLFASSRNLGTAKETKREMMSRALRERAAGISQTDESILFEKRPEPIDDSEDEDLDDEDVGKKAELLVKDGEVTQSEKTGISEPPAPSVVAGSGLKRPLELDDEGRPLLRKRQKRGGVKSKFSGNAGFIPEIPLSPSNDQLETQGEPKDEDEDEDDEWNGFSSDDAASADEQEESGTESSSASADEGTSEEDTSSEDEDDEDDGNAAKTRSSAFKAWAHEQRNSALGYQPNNGNTTLEFTVPQNFKPRPIEQDPLPLELQPTKDTGRKAYSVVVERLSEIQEARLKLPVVAEEQRIMEAIHNNNVVIVCGATGSGKSTQVPQMLFEAGYGSPDSPTPGQIVVTQPRKVAAVSVSQRVSTELGSHSDAVAYQIRFEGTASEKTRLKFVTDGVLLREIGNDISLLKYSAVIIDEAHERSLNTDILIGMLSRTVKLREEMASENPKISPLKLIIMSATLRISDVTNSTLFPTPPPVLNIEGRQYPVAIHFARRTQPDYVDEAFKKIIRGHRKLPPGSMLVFLTSHSEISRLSQKLKLHQTGLKSASYPKIRFSANDGPLEVEDIEFGQTSDDVTGNELDELQIIGDEQDMDEEEEAEFDIPNETGQALPLKMHILPLYSLLPTREQMKVFEEPPEGSRSIILATNVAETSLTIPGVKYVIDCGRSKERVFDPDTGVQRYEIGFISKASANQRSGRAGRTGPGHTWRLYSSAVYERDLQEYADPEILKMPIEGVVLQLKAMNLKHVVNFPFPTSPDRHSLAKAEKLLQHLSAINADGFATQIGKTMSKLPLPPRFARILLVGHLHDCLSYTIALVAGLSVAEIFLPESQVIPPETAEDDEGGQGFRTNEDIAAENARAQARRKYNEVHRNFRSLDDASDAIKLLQVVGEFAHSPSESWCTSRFVRFKALQETQKLRKQITTLLQKDIPAFANLTFKERLDRPSAKQVTALKQMVAAGFIDQVAIRGDLAPVPPEMHRKPRRAIDVPYLPLQPLPTPASTATGDALIDRAVFIHPSSSLSHYSPQELPEYVIYSGLQRSSASGPVDGAKKPKTRMLALTDVTGAQLSALAKGTPLISYGKTIKEVLSEPGASTRECWVVPYLRAEGTGGQGWPLPVKKVAQKKVPGKGWITE